MSILKVSFSDPVSDPVTDWTVLTLQHSAGKVSIYASVLYPSLLHLVKALQLLRLFPGTEIVTWGWTEASEEHDMVFTREAQVITLDVLRFSDSRRRASQQDKILSVSADYGEVCLPFWRALRSLQGRLRQMDMEERWRNSFPWQELDALTAELGKRPRP